MAQNQHLLTQDDLERAFREIGVSEGMFLEVHSSLSSFGYVDGGALSVIHALMTVVGTDGALVMPTFPCSLPLPLSESDKRMGIYSKVRRFDPSSDEPSGMGVVPDTFRCLPDVLTGTDEHRVSAWGKDKEENSKGFRNLIDKNGHALMIGVDIYRLTSMHYMESRLPSEIQHLYDPPEEVSTIYPPDKWYIQMGEPPVKGWYTVQEEAYRQGFIKDLVIGKSKCMFFAVNDVIRIYERALAHDAYSLFGVNR